MIELTEFIYSDNTKTVEGVYYTIKENSIIEIDKNLDLVSGKYEGGLKLWECSIDLLKYLKTLPSLPLKVLELGCGQGLPGIYCAQQSSFVTFQDYNLEVLKFVTANNAVKNNCMNCRYFYGPWGDVSHLGTFDLVLTSETIYNPENYSALLTAIWTSQAKVALVACKNYYFGVGGGSELFVKAAHEFGFCCQVLQRIDDVASTRFIIQLTKE